MHCNKFSWKWPSGSFVNVFLLFRNYLPLEKSRVLHLNNQLYILDPRMICAKFGWNWPSGSGEEDFLTSSMHCSNFLIFSSWKRAKPFVWTNLNPLHPRMLCAKFGWTWPSCSGEDDFSNLLMYFRNFEIISPWIWGGSFIWTNLNPLHPRMHCDKFGSKWFSGCGEEDF